MASFKRSGLCNVQAMSGSEQFNVTAASTTIDECVAELDTASSQGIELEPAGISLSDLSVDRWRGVLLIKTFVQSSHGNIQLFQQSTWDKLLCFLRISDAYGAKEQLHTSCQPEKFIISLRLG